MARAANGVTTPLMTSKDIGHCVDMYLARLDGYPLPLSRERCYESLWNHVRLKKFARAWRVDGEIVAWITAEKAHPKHVSEPIFMQTYYACALEGYAVVKPLITLHEALYQETLNQGLAWAYSSASPLDEHFVLPRILAKFGWTQQGYAAVRRGVAPGESTGT